MVMFTVSKRWLLVLLSLIVVFSLLSHAIYAREWGRDPTNPLYWGNQPSLHEAFSEYFVIGIGYANHRYVWDYPGVEDGVFLHYQAVTAGNRLKPGVLLSSNRPNDWVWNWGNIPWAGDADGLVRLAEENEMAMIGHTLVWHGQSVAWLTTQTDAQGVPLEGAPPVTREQAIYNLHRHISTVAGRYSGQIYSWDVLNEAVYGAGSGDWRRFLRRGRTSPGGPGGFSPWYRGDSQWYNAFANGAVGDECGSDYVYYAFKFARRYDPFAVLYYNDYNDEHPPKARVIADMVIAINNRWAHDMVNNHEAVPEGQEYTGRLLIEGIGMQGHYSIDRWTAGGLLNPAFYTHIRNAIEAYRDTGARISITELDIAINSAGPGHQGNALTRDIPNLNQGLMPDHPDWIRPTPGWNADQAYAAGFPRTPRLGEPHPMQLEWQAQRYAQLFRIWLENQDYIARITFWNINDYHSWIRPTHGEHVDENWNIKPAWTAVMETLNDAPTPNIAPPVIGTAIITQDGTTSSIDAIPAGFVGERFGSIQFTAARNNWAPIRWRVIDGELPVGMVLNAATGVLRGTPRQAGEFNITIEASNARYAETKSITLTVDAFAPLPWDYLESLDLIQLGGVHGATHEITYNGLEVLASAYYEGVGVNIEGLRELARGDDRDIRFYFLSLDPDVAGRWQFMHLRFGMSFDVGSGVSISAATTTRETGVLTISANHTYRGASGALPPEGGCGIVFNHIDSYADGEQVGFIITDITVGGESVFRLIVEPPVFGSSDRGDGTFTNPVIWADVPDPSIIRVGDTFWMSSTTMHMNPGVPIMRSFDLVNWETVSYVYHVMEDMDDMKLQTGGYAYSHGTWASSLRYNYDTGTFILVVHSWTSSKTYIFQTEDPITQPWRRYEIPRVFHDSGLLLDDDGRNWLAWGVGRIYIIELNETVTGIRQGASQRLLLPTMHAPDPHTGIVPETGLAEGTHLQKIDDMYFVFGITWAPGQPRTQVAHRSTSLEGPWESKVIGRENIVFGSGGGVAQGGIVDDGNGNWFGFAFRDSGSVGRAPWIVPITWVDGWPMFGEDGSYTNLQREGPIPIQSDAGLKSVVASDEFNNDAQRPVYLESTLFVNPPRYPDGSLYRPQAPQAEQEQETDILACYDDNGSHLSLVWQWNHNPDNRFWSMTERPGWLRLQTGHLSTNIIDAPNTLTQRTFGPQSAAVVKIDVSGMKDGDEAGLSLFAARYGSIGVRVENGRRYVVTTLSNNWTTADGNMGNRGEEDARVPLPGYLVYLKAEADFLNQIDRGRFFYSQDGLVWNRLGGDLIMQYRIENHFMGYRFALYNFATETTGGYADFDFFRLTNVLGGEGRIARDALYGPLETLVIPRLVVLPEIQEVDELTEDETTETPYEPEIQEPETPYEPEVQEPETPYEPAAPEAPHEPAPESEGRTNIGLIVGIVLAVLVAGAVVFFVLKKKS